MLLKLNRETIQYDWGIRNEILIELDKGQNSTARIRLLTLLIYPPVGYIVCIIFNPLYRPGLIKFVIANAIYLIYLGIRIAIKIYLSIFRWNTFFTGQKIKNFIRV